MIFDQPKVFGQFIAEETRRVGRKFRPDLLWNFFTQSAPAELILVPQDLRTVDPVLAQEFYNGVYSFAGRRVETKGVSPFEIKGDSVVRDESWQRELHSFSWLRHLRSSKNAISGSHAQSLVRDWINNCGKPRKCAAWQPDVAAKRLISWLSHSVLIVDQADIKLYKQFLNSIRIHIRFLRSNLVGTSEELSTLQVSIALCYAALCTRLRTAPKAGAARIPHETLGNLLARQIFADGGHISRCPAVLPQILIDLLPLRQSYDRLGIAPPQELLTAIDRMMPAIRFYRHRDGNFARFNGVGCSQQELIATVLRYDDAMGKPTREASQSGYQRMTGGATTLIMDVGNPPNIENTKKAHAGCLSFEMSSLRTCFITNCGIADNGDEAQLSASRSTAAHSTAVVHNTSSCHFQKPNMFTRNLGMRMLTGPQRASSERNIVDGYTQIVARHDGYLHQFGVWHERILQLSDDGNVLLGRDQFFADGGKPPINMRRDDCAIRFHLHPSVSARIDENNGVIVIHANQNQSWKFVCDAGQVGLEESIFFASPAGPKPTSQIVINLKLSQLSAVNWRFEQTIGTRSH
jgi:uncharacterized heparinase superfamily protein